MGPSFRWDDGGEIARRPGGLQQTHVWSSWAHVRAEVISAGTRKLGSRDDASSGSTRSIR